MAAGSLPEENSKFSLERIAAAAKDRSPQAPMLARNQGGSPKLQSCPATVYALTKPIEKELVQGEPAVER